MSVVLSIDETGPWQKQLKVEVPAPAVEAEMDRVTQEFRKQARLPGFRKGRVPAGVIRQRFGEDIRREVIDRLLPRYWRQAQAEAQVEPLLPPKVEEIELEDGQPFTFVATVEVQPEVELNDLEFELPQRDALVTEPEIDQALEDLRREAAGWIDANRAATQGDRVDGTLRKAEDDPPGQEVVFEVGDPNVWEELSLAVTGQSVGQEVSFDRADDAGASESEEGESEGSAGKVDYRLQITAVQERDLANLDDAFAASLGKFESLEELRDDLRRRLLGAKEAEARRERERALLEQLTERYPLEPPQGVLDDEVQHMVNEYAQGLAMRGVDVENADIEWREVAQQLEPQARRRVHSRLLLDAAAEHLSVELSEETFEAALAELAQAQGQTPLAARQALDKNGRLGEFRTQLKRQATLRRLLGEKEPAPQAEPDSEEE